MPVEREELLAATGLMPQNHDRSVVLRSRIIRDDLHHGIQRRPHRRAWLYREVYAQVNSAPFVRGISARTEQWRNVKQAWFIVTAHTNGRASSLQHVKYFFGENGNFRGVGVGAKKRTTNTKVKNVARGSSQINIQDRGRGACARFQPLLDLFTLRNGRKPASRTKSVVSETRVDFFESLQGFPRRRFADRDVPVIRPKGFAVRGISDADGQPRADQSIQNGQLQLIEWKRAMVSRDEGSSRFQWVFLPQDGVSCGNRRLRHSEPVVQIAKINHAHDLSGLRPGFADQHVVVV